MYVSLMRLATSAKSKGLSDFIVEGEKRYWLHVAIERFDASGGGGGGGSGNVKVLSQQLEEVTE